MASAPLVAALVLATSPGALSPEEASSPGRPLVEGQFGLSFPSGFEACLKAYPAGELALRGCWSMPILGNAPVDGRGDLSYSFRLLRRGPWELRIGPAVGVGYGTSSRWSVDPVRSSIGGRIETYVVEATLVPRSVRWIGPRIGVFVQWEFGAQWMHNAEVDGGGEETEWLPRLGESVGVVFKRPSSCSSSGSNQSPAPPP